MKHYNHYPILMISDINNRVLKLKLTYYPAEQEKFEELDNILVRESHIAEALDFLLEHFYLIQRNTDNQITFEVGTLEILNDYRKSINIREIGDKTIKEDFEVKININFTLIESDTTDFLSMLKKFINEQEEDALQKMVDELEMMSRRKRQSELVSQLCIKENSEDIRKKI